jgi:hypothetical protein
VRRRQLLQVLDRPNRQTDRFTSRRLAMRVDSFAPYVSTTALVVAFLPLAASAQAILPAPYYFGSISNGGADHEFLAPGTYALDEASVAVLGFPQPSLLGRADGHSDASATFSGDISYSFTVDGPVSGVVVPLFAMYALHASAVGGVTNALATFSITGTRNDFFEKLTADGAFSNPAGINATRPVGLEPGRIGVISLGIGGLSFGGLADAYVDPYIFVDPAFLASNPGYSVRVSAGIGNAPLVSTVPEPETYALMMLGLGLLASRRLAAKRREA